MTDAQRINDSGEGLGGGPTPSGDASRLPIWGRLEWAALGIVTLAAAILRLVGLNRPTSFVFDEIFYARDACWYVIGTEAACNITELTSRAHPPLGKWLVGSGIAIFGYDPVGWRVAAAAAGTVTVALTFVLAWRLMRPVVGSGAARLGAFAAGSLLATDFLHLVQSRVGMLDVFIALFVVAATLAIVLDRDRASAVGASAWARLALGRPWRLVAGAALGAAAATKWSGAYVALAVIGLTIAWEIAAERRRRGGGWGGAFLGAVRREALPTAILLGLVPLAVYLASYAGRMPGEILSVPWAAGSLWRNLYDHQQAMLEFHTSLGGHHPYESPPWSWLVLKRPVAYWFSAEGGVHREILALGNPFVWWPALIGMIVLAITWVRGGASVRHPTVVVLAGALATYAPWLVLSGSRSQVFLWYLLPTVPFLCLALGLVAAGVWQRVAGRVATAAYGAIVLASFLFFFPVLTALPIGPNDWWQRVWFRDCARPDGPALTLPDDEINQGRPPEGWCWI